MEVFCDQIISYIKTETTTEKIISLTLRDIFLNDLIYIESFNKWKQYDQLQKVWRDFDESEIASKINKLQPFFKKDLLTYLNSTEKNTKTKTFSKELFYMKREITNIITFIESKNTKCIETITSQCRDLFKVHL